MNTRTYLMLSGAIFCLVAILHLLRVVNGWDMAIGPWPVPMWFSWGGVLIPAMLCLSAFRLAARTPAAAGV